MTLEWVAFTAVICTFIVFALWVTAWSEHKKRDDGRIRTFGGSRPGSLPEVQMRTSGGTSPEEDDDE